MVSEVIHFQYVIMFVYLDAAFCYMLNFSFLVTLECQFLHTFSGKIFVLVVSEDPSADKCGDCRLD